MKGYTPMMAQYRAIKAKNPDALLLFRLGDFYEMFFEDAEVGSEVLGIALTGRDAGKGKRAPMCGVPHHAVDDYIRTLVQKGFKVAICDQLEEPTAAKGLVKRDVVRVVTPGTYWEGADETSASYIAGILRSPTGARRQDEPVSIALCDLSTGETLIASFGRDEGRRPLDRAIEELSRFGPKECVVEEGRESDDIGLAVEKRLPRTFLSVFTPTSTCMERELAAHSSSAQNEQAHGAVDGEVEPDVPSEQQQGGLDYAALDFLKSYLSATQMTSLTHMKRPRRYLLEGYMEMDRSTRQNLELVERLQGGREGTLAWVLDRCSTTMGSRLLRQWIERPLSEAEKIRDRLDLVEEIYKDSGSREGFRRKLRQVKDLERLVTKISYGACNARDLVALASSLEAIPSVAALLEKSGLPLARDIFFRLDSLPEIVRQVRSAIVSEPPLSVREGYLIQDGFSPLVDELRDLAKGGKTWLSDLETKEREETGIKNLKVGFNKVFGYYIEVTQSNLPSVPERYIRRQTLAACERFITPELKEKETAILGAEERLFREEYRLFCDVRDRVASFTERVQKTAEAVSELDVLVSFAQAAFEHGYVRPRIVPSGGITIKDGRHPVLDKVLPQGGFVPNDAELGEKDRLLVITGPNMGGKSTYCRQTALIVLMAQMGCFVPAKACSLSCMDKLFARVGAYDDLVLGQSTFMVEMSEVARILRGVTPKSLVILDELGRGTGTFDGMAVAWAVLEHLWDAAGGAKAVSGPYALVATHYRELTLLADLKPGVANFHVSVKKKGDDVVFLRKVVRGVAEGSFGIEVSAMAGLPDKVVKRAREILLGLESEARKGARWKSGILGQVASRGLGALDTAVPGQTSLFGTEVQDTPSVTAFTQAALEVAKDLLSFEPDSMSPLEALAKLYEIRDKLADTPEDNGTLGKDGAK